MKRFMAMYKRKEDYFYVNTYQGDVIQRIRPNEKHLDQFLHNVVRCSFKTLFDILQQENITMYPVKNTCLPFNRELFLTSKGKIFPCETIARTYPLGYISDNIVHLSPSYIANLYNKKIQQQIDYCSLCFSLPFCFNCLFQVLPTTEKDMKCPQFMGEKELIDYLTVYLDYLESYPSEFSLFCLKN